MLTFLLFGGILEANERAFVSEIGLVYPFLRRDTLQTAERLFNDNVRYTKAMIYRRPAKAWIWGGLKVGPNEVIGELKKRGVNITVRTLQNWVNAGLVPKPERGRKGTGGSWADYPPETVPEALTVHLLKDIQRLRNAEIAEARKGYYEGKQTPFSDAWGQVVELLKQGNSYSEVHFYANEARQGFLNAEITLSHFTKNKEE